MGEASAGRRSGGGAVPEREQRVSTAPRPDQPTGIVTFVFTDIEGSTRLLKRVPDRAPAIFDRHDEILREAWRAHRGYEVSTEGDSFFVAFHRCDDALEACLRAQRGIAGEPWPEGGSIHVRMGVHTGPATTRGDNYIALAIHQAARVATAANGGQILVTDAAAQRAAVPPGSRLTPLGRFRLRDFDAPQPLFRLDHEALAVTERPIRAMPAEGHNLVRRPTSFLGREADVSNVAELLGAGRLVTLTGPGGAGKTRLATEVGLAHVADWPDGVWFVDLADLVDSSLVPDTLADTLGAPSGTSTGRWDDAAAHLRDRSTLIVLDNVESHIDTCAAVVADLLARCPGLGVVATGREPLNIDGEATYLVGPLPAPALDGGLAAVERSPAAQLFCERALAAHPGFTLDEATAADVAKVCARLDGLPLALEIAGAKAGVLGLQEIVDGLDDRFRLLRSRSRSLPERQRTMQGLLDWSYRLLDEDERTVLRRLAVFGGTFSIDAATAAVASSDLPADDVAELVWALVDKSLVTAELGSAEARYGLHETVREYARRLLDDGEGGETAERLGEWLLGRIGPWLTPDRTWTGRVAVDLANLRSLVAQLADRDHEAAQRIACTIAHFHESVQSFSSGIDELTGIVAALDAPTPTRVVVLALLADLHLRRAEIESARDLVDHAERLEEVVGCADWADAVVERTHGEVAIRSGDLDRAAAIADAALDGDLSARGRARMWSQLGVARYSRGDIDGAAEAFERELAAYRELGHDAKIASAHGNLAEVALQQGNRSTAARHQLRCLELAEALGLPVMLAYSCIVASRMAVEDGRWEVAVQLQAAADVTLAETGHELYAADRAAVERFFEDARVALGREAIHRAVAEGGALALGESTRIAGTVLRSATGVAQTGHPEPEQGSAP